jgi:hypothetical protein
MQNIRSKAPLCCTAIQRRLTQDSWPLPDLKHGVEVQHGPYPRSTSMDAALPCNHILRGILNCTSKGLQYAWEGFTPSVSRWRWCSRVVIAHDPEAAYGKH